MLGNDEIEQKVLATIRAEYPTDRQERLLMAFHTYKDELMREINDGNKTQTNRLQS